MIRLALVAAGAFALVQTPPAQDVVADVHDFRERQHLVGQRLGCEMQLAQAAIDGDLEGYRERSAECAKLEREHEQL